MQTAMRPHALQINDASVTPVVTSRQSPFLLLQSAPLHYKYTDVVVHCAVQGAPALLNQGSSLYRVMKGFVSTMKMSTNCHAPVGTA